MKHLATFLYWLAAVFALALILVSFDYRFGRALFLATSLLPGMFCAKFFRRWLFGQNGAGFWLLFVWLQAL